jgi:hypothetical protein
MYATASLSTIRLYNKRRETLNYQAIARALDVMEESNLGAVFETDSYPGL